MYLPSERAAKAYTCMQYGLVKYFETYFTKISLK